MLPVASCDGCKKLLYQEKLAYNLPDEALDISLGLSFGLDSVCKHIGHDVNLSF